MTIVWKLRLSLMLVFFLLLVQVPWTTTAFQFKKDTGEDCSSVQVEDCQQERGEREQKVWFSCPLTCADRLSMEGSMAEIHETPEAFFQFPVKPLLPMNDDNPPHSHSHFPSPPLSLEDYEGYVTVVAVVPTAYPGMAQFQYQLLEHVASVYPFTVQILLVPLDPPPQNNNNHPTHNKDDELEPSSSSETPPPPRWKPPRRNGSNNNNKVMILEPMTLTVTTTTPPSLSTSFRLVEYLAQAHIVAGNHASRPSPPSALVWDDRVTIFLVSFDGMFIERLIAPTLVELERRIAVHLLQLEVQAEL